MKDINIHTEFITLGQFLKLAHCVSTGGDAKMILIQNQVKVNGAAEIRRGRKLYGEDIVTVDGCGQFRIVLHKEA